MSFQETIPHRLDAPDVPGGHKEKEEGRKGPPSLGEQIPPPRPPPPPPAGRKGRGAPVGEKYNASRGHAAPAPPDPVAQDADEIPTPARLLPDQVALASQPSNEKNGSENTGVRTLVGVTPPPASATYTLQVVGTVDRNATLSGAPVKSGSFIANATSSTSSPTSQIADSSRIQTTLRGGTTANATSLTSSSTSLGSLVTALATMPAVIPSSTPNINAAAMSNSNVPDSSNIFRRDNKLFPLAIIIIVVGVLFFLAAIGIVWLRLSGCTKKRKIRSANQSWANNEKGMFEPLPFDFRTNEPSIGIASTAASTRGVHTWAPPVPPRPPRPAVGLSTPLGWEWEREPTIPRGAYDGSFIPYSQPPHSLLTAAPRGPTPPAVGLHKPLPDPFHSSHDNLTLPLPTSAAGSPVPSFATERSPHDEDVLPCPKGRANSKSQSPHDPFGDAHGSLIPKPEGYGYVTVHRSSSSSGSSISSYTVPPTSRSFARSSSGAESMMSNYLATYLLPTAEKKNCPKEEEAALAMLRSAGSCGRGTLANDAGWKTDQQL